MSWMDDGGFDLNTFTALDGGTLARMVFRTSKGQFDVILSKTDLQRIRREIGRTLKELNQKKEQK